MKAMNHRILAAAVLALASTALGQATQPAVPAQRFSLTVYSSADPATFDPKGDDQPNYGRPTPLPGYGVVREIRSIDLKDGENTLRFTDVASGIDPTTVSFLSLTDPAGTAVLEQSYEFDLVSSLKLLQKYVDQEVIVERSAQGGKTEIIKGTLLSAEGSLVVRQEEGNVRIINGYTGIQLAGAAGLITKPTLVWDVTTHKAGKHDAQVAYQTSGLTWRADYNVVLNENDTKVDLGAWVTVVNRSGASYPDARLKLVAGDVQRIQPQDPYGRARETLMKAMAADKAQAPGFAEKSFFEYHLYTLGRTTPLPNNSTKQIELFEKKIDVPVEKVYVYHGTPREFNLYRSGGFNANRDLGIEMNKKVDTYVRLDNTEKNGLGIPLPAGRLRVYKRDDADNSLEFIGEDVIQHTTENEKVLVKLGSAFDIVGERVQTDFKIDNDAHWATESFEIKVRNHKKEKVSVLITETLYRGANWSIPEATDAWTKQDFQSIRIPVEVPVDSEKVVKYTVKYTW